MATHYELTHFEVGDESRTKQKTITTKTYEAVSGLGADKLYGFFVVAKHNSIKDSDKSKTIEIKLLDVINLVNYMPHNILELQAIVLHMFL